LDELVKFDGGQKTQVAIYAYLNKYGMRCTGEIDITKTRWSEKPTTLVLSWLLGASVQEVGLVLQP
jgi:rifampicin phosphotransferase